DARPTDGRSPGSRVFARHRLPGFDPVACGTGSPLTVAGAAAELGANVPHRIPCCSFAGKRPPVESNRGAARAFVNARTRRITALAWSGNLRENCFNQLMATGGINALRSRPVHRRLPQVPRARSRPARA